MRDRRRERKAAEGREERLARDREREVETGEGKQEKACKR